MKFGKLFARHPESETSGTTPNICIQIRILNGMVTAMRLRKNKDGYRGESIDLDKIQHQLENPSNTKGWKIEHLPYGKTAQESLLFLESSDTHHQKKVLLSGGIHGDEPATTAAIAQLILNEELPGDISYYVFPCLNPTGLRQGVRENADGFDLNRDYFKKQTNEVQTHLHKLNALPRLDLALHLHEDWEAAGFYLYELSQENTPATHGRSILDEVGNICPIEMAAKIEGMPAERGLIHPRHRYLDRTDWPEAFYMMQHKTNHCLTLEAPSDFEMTVRVTALKTAVQQAIAISQGVSPNY